MTQGAAWTVRNFTQADAPAFAALNRRWIDEIFGAEEEDLRILGHPEREIIAKGGQIAVADQSGWIVGTGAIIPPHHQPDDGKRWLEVIKMATDPSAQGRGIGGAILDHLIDFARTKGADALWLETNSKLEAATALYRKAGFRTLSPDDAWPTPYQRCNLQMVMEL
jgi:GNAT superfamily N-acetyltransferase